MEFPYNLRQIAHEQFVKIDHTLLPVGYQHEDPELQKIIAEIVEKMGKASGLAQDLKSPITSADKLKNSDHILYLMFEETSPGHFVVVGLLKMGWKKLYLFNKKGTRSEALVYCLLDFYIHETKQRHGYGIKLMEYMLNDSNIQARQLAIDQPTSKLMQFLWKYFNLSKLVNQGNNFVIYEDYFENDGLAEKQSDGNDRSSGYKSQATYGRHGATKKEDCMANILYGNEKEGKVTQNLNEQENRNELKEINQQRNEHHIEVQRHHEEIQQKQQQQHQQQQNRHHPSDESDGHNHTHPKLDIKNFHTQLW